MNRQDFEDALLTDGTVDSVKFNGKAVGSVGRDKHSSKQIFVWIQEPLRFASKATQTAYSMSVPLLEKLEEIGVDEVFIVDAERQVSLDEIRQGTLLTPDDNRFNNPPKHDQWVVHV